MCVCLYVHVEVCVCGSAGRPRAASSGGVTGWALGTRFIPLATLNGHSRQRFLSGGGGYECISGRDEKYFRSCCFLIFEIFKVFTTRFSTAKIYFRCTNSLLCAVLLLQFKNA